MSECHFVKITLKTKLGGTHPIFKHSGRQWQEDLKFEASLANLVTVRSCLKILKIQEGLEM